MLMQMRNVTRMWVAAAVAVAVALITAAPAAAKAEPVLKACGADACRTTTDEATLRPLVNIGRPVPAPPPSQRASWFRIVMTWTWYVAPGKVGHDGWVMQYFPAAGMMRDRHVWVRLPDATIAKFSELTRGLDPRGAVASTPAAAARPESTESSGGLAATSILAGLALAGIVVGALVIGRRARRTGGRLRRSPA
jgi:hypothetical protein